MIEYGTHPDDPVEDHPRRRAVQSDVAERVTGAMMLNRFRYVPGIGWHEFTGGRWLIDAGRNDAVREATRAFIRQRIDELRMNQRETEAEAWKGCLRRTELDDITILMRGMLGVATPADQLDRHHDYVNCTNGVVDLRTGSRMASTPSMLMTKQAGAPYDPAARSDTWNEVLAAVPLDVRDWLQLRIGQALSGWTEDSLVLTVGGGQNGKSAFMKAIMRAFGDYAKLISHRVLMQGASNQHPTELMDLRGLRMAVLEETPEEGNLDTHQLKTIIGTPQINARKMRQDNITFNTTHTLFINTNHYPVVSTTDHGTWRRLVACRFPFKFVAEDPRAGERLGDPTIKHRIDSDPTLPAAALAWAIRGARRWYEDPDALHTLPPAVRDATDAWRSDSDVGFQFAQEHLELSRTALLPVAVMAAKFGEFLEAQGKRRWSNQTINARLPQSIRAALGQEVVPDRIRITDRHRLGTADPFDQVRHALVPDQFVRAWIGVRLRAPGQANVDNMLTDRGLEPAQLELEADTTRLDQIEVSRGVRVIREG